jgi:5-dehydro-4-deoxyglucarate dehydratase
MHVDDRSRERARPAPVVPGGIWSFPISPFTAEGELDADGLVASIERQVADGVDAIVVNGALAEVDSLTPREWAIAASAAAGFAARVPILAALPSEGKAALAAASAVAASPVTALLVLPQLSTTGDKLVSHARAVSQAAGVPTVLYQRGSMRLDARQLSAPIADGTVVGLKDGTRDFRALRRLMEELAGEITIAAAFEDMSLPYWALGVDAFCPASTAHDPAYSRAWFVRLQRGDVAGARTLLEAFAYPLTDLRLSRPGIDIAVVKEVVRLRGHAAGGVRAPGAELTESERARVAALVARLDEDRANW